MFKRTLPNYLIQCWQLCFKKQYWKKWDERLTRQWRGCLFFQEVPNDILLSILLFIKKILDMVWWCHFWPQMINCSFRWIQWWAERRGGDGRFWGQFHKLFYALYQSFAPCAKLLHNNKPPKSWAYGANGSAWGANQFIKSTPEITTIFLRLTPCSVFGDKFDSIALNQ